MIKQVLNFVLFFCCATSLQAHTVWIETEPNGKLNKPQEIKIFFGEPDSPTFTAKWFSDIKDIRVKLVSPSGKEQMLEKQQKESYYSAFFTPTEKGIYTISVNHLVKDVFKEMKITYQSVTFVNVGVKESKELVLGDLPLQLGFDTFIPKTEKTKIFKFLKEEKIAEKERVSITSENGWSMSYRTNNKGEIKFTPLWKGKYLVEFSWSKKEEGNHHGTPYQADYQTINYLIQIK